MKRIYVLITFLFVILSCKTEESNNKITVGVHSWPGGGMVYVGKEKGIFKKHGVEIDIKKIESFDTKRSSLVSGNIDLDIANTLDQAIIYNSNNNFQAQILSITDESVGGDGLVVSGVNNLNELKGKKIAYAEASPSDFFLRYILVKNNIDLSSVSLVPVADPQVAGTAFISGEVDAAITYEPFLSQSLKRENSKILISTKDYPTLIPGLIIGDKAKIKNDEELYRNFLKGWFESVEFYYGNKDESYEIISKGMGMDKSEVKEILSVVDIQTKQQNLLLFDESKEGNIYELTEYISDFWIQNGFTEKKAVSKDLIYPKYINEK